MNANVLDELKALEIDRVISLHLTNGTILTGAICESHDNEVVLFDVGRIGLLNGSTSDCAYHHVPHESVVAWTDRRSGSGNDPMYLNGNRYETRKKDGGR